MIVQFANQSGFTVRVIRAGSSVCAGMGFVVGDRHVVTCAHVVNSALGRPQRQQDCPDPDSRVQIEFPMLGDGEGGPVRNCQIEAWVPPALGGVSGGDVAGLVLVGEGLPQGAGRARLNSPSAYRETAVSVFGYPGDPPRLGNGAVARLRLAGGVGGGLIQLDSVSSAAVRAQAGYSGSAVVTADAAGDAVLGMLVAAGNGRETRDSYALSAVRIASAWPDIVRIDEPAAAPSGPNSETGLRWRLEPERGQAQRVNAGSRRPAARPPLPLFAQPHSAVLSPEDQLNGEGSNVQSLHFSPDGGLLAVRSGVSQAEQITLWDAAAGRFIGELDLDGDYAVTVRFSPDGSLLVSETMLPGNREHGARAWNTDDLQLVASLVGAPKAWGEALSLQFSADGRFLAGIVDGQGGGVRVWDTATFSAVQDLDLRGGAVRWVQFTSDGRLFGGVERGGGLRVWVWDAATFEPITRMDLDQGRFARVTLNEAGQFLAHAVDDGLEIWDIDTYEPATVLRIREVPVRSFTASSDGRWLAANAGGGNFMGLFEAREPMYVWDTSDFSLAAVLMDERKEGCGRATFRQDGELLAARVHSRKGAEIRVWRTGTFDCVAISPSRLDLSGLEFSPDGRFLAGVVNNSIGCWSLEPVEDSYSGT